MRSYVFFLFAGAAWAQPDVCANLDGLKLPDVALMAVTRVPARGVLPEHCQVRGEIDRRVGFGGQPFAIGFELRLPADWEGRFLFQGGGGMDGQVRNAMGQLSFAGKPALARGFAVVSTDGGHQSKSSNPSTDPSFARDQQSRIDNAYRAIDRVTMVSKAIVAAHYGQPWKRAYFGGCSNGGRQGMMAAQRFPTYFDGIVSGAPAFRVTKAAIGSAWETIALTAIAPKGPDGKPILSRALTDADLKSLADGILQACDAADGLADGMVFNTESCRFDPASVNLTPAQIGAVRKVFGGPVNSRGEALYSDWPWDPGLNSVGWRALKLGNSPNSTPDSADVNFMFQGLTGYFMTPFDPAFDPMRFDFDKDPKRVDDTAALQDPTSTHLSTFIERGGKLLFYHGMADPFFSAKDTVRYYKQMAADNGGLDKTLGWSRLFLVPGMTHCGGGPSLDNFDVLAAIVAWVEDGKAPDQMKANGNAFPGRSRPLCAYPKFARYDGKGPVEDAGSFVCQ